MGTTIIQLAVCDDDSEIRKKLLSWILKVDLPANYKILLTDFSSGTALVDSYRAGHRYDLIFLDMIMPGIDGIETARQIRSFDEKVLIIFLTSSSDFAVQSYHVEAFDYLLKTEDTERMESVFRKALAFIAGKEDRQLQIRSGATLHVIQCNKIEYIEIYAKKLSFHLIPEQVLETYKPIRDLEIEIAGLANFFKIHRSVIVNLSYITQINPKFVVTISTQRLPVARGKYCELEKAFISYTADQTS